MYAETSCKEVDVVHVVKISSVVYGEWGGYSEL